MYNPIPEVALLIRLIVLDTENYFAVLGDMNAVHSFQNEVRNSSKHDLGRVYYIGNRFN